MSVLRTPVRIGVLASGSGTNLQSLIDHFNGAASTIATVAWVGSNVSTAGALARAQSAGIAHAVIREEGQGSSLLDQLQAAQVELLVLAGYLKLVPRDVVEAYQGRLLNIHPSLLPSFGGDGMYGARVHAAVLAHGVKITGATVHFVDEHFDRGAIVAQWPVPVHVDDTVETLAARVLQVEHQLLPLTVEAVATGHVTLQHDGTVAGEIPVPALPLPVSSHSPSLHRPISQT